MLVDGILALAVCLNTELHALRHGPPAAVCVLLGGALCLAARRRAPSAVLAATVASVIAFALLGGTYIPLPFATLVALYTVASMCPLRVSAGAACGAAAAVAAAMAVGQGTPDDDIFDRLPLIAAAWLLGYGGRLARERAALMERQAAQLEREQETRTRVAVLDEQARIARELHDVVAHHITLIVAQATAAACGRPRPDRDRGVLDGIAGGGRQALGELRRLLGALDPQAEPPLDSSTDPSARASANGSADPSTTGPQPGLGQLAALVDQVERSGLPVQLTVRGRPRPLPVGVELGAYRIVQEALTNALKHAGPATAQVELDYQPGQLALRISDDGVGAQATPHAAGYGLPGMMRRAAALGGWIGVGPSCDHSFQVSALLPVPEG